ncbi:ABC transporter ATP-binding protein [Actinacidiphila bryophytorum]|uniref:ABC-2 type transport system ATP-binding protein n=1 Tax=Actinacidiphila bryophytorum TaxID=1436133 RepID=A0A9W4H496_9ACTN|nr:ABC transporter ATP-binding protein [Actinacidiphila bryophytorum]MBM9435784.1 ABC transporter ATP-binding protein [Actinacidiphila bryophytorum]MBN6541627.1 ABC transporter ATP-binding protein [Actinacidiphila bryophytorum]CAG7650257.1 ABC-2 type transport system ATP-binding protein [Actinacidiphila bryophytorum]
METVRCEGLGKTYGRAVAVGDLNLSVEAGQVYGFLGPNGSGKTTTMRMLLGLIRPTSGRAWLNGRALPDPAGLAHVGAMIEEPAFHPWMTGRRSLEVLALYGPPFRRADAVAEALGKVGLTSAADRKVKTYSQGMRQRLGLALALMRAPSVVLLDEPMNGMDPAAIREFRATVRCVADSGTTVFLSSHQLTEVEQICDRVAVMTSGRVIAEGRPDDLTTAVVRVVLAPADRAAARTLLSSSFPVRAEDSDALVVGSGDGHAVNELLGRGGVWAHQIRVERSGLERAFLALTGPTGEEVEDDAASPR